MTQRKTHFHWSTGNTKLKKLGTISFNIPAFRSKDGFATCPQAGACATLCYARQGLYVMPAVAKVREENLSLVRAALEKGGSDFLTELLVEDLHGFAHKSVRIHDSGDFFSQAYLDAWMEVAKQLPSKLFYAYTKSLHLDWSKAPAQMKIIQSVGGLLDKKIDPTKSHSKIFVTDAERVRSGYVDGNTNDQPAMDGVVKIGLVYHGSKKLKKGQERWLQSSGARFRAPDLWEDRNAS